MYKINVKSRFSAAHHLRNYKGDCENIHGHNWEVSVTAEFTELSRDGIAIDFRDLKQALHKVIDELDHTDLNSMDYFRETNPTSENVAEYIYRGIKKQGIPLVSVTVSETSDYSATYSEEAD